MALQSKSLNNYNNIIYRVGKTSLIKKLSKEENNNNEDILIYKKTEGIIIYNKTYIFTEVKENEPNEINIKLIDTPGDIDYNNNNILIKILSNIKALFIIFDIINESSFNKINDIINIIQKYYEEKKEIKIFNSLPILIIGNKIDLNEERKIKKNDVENFVNKIQKDKNLVYINYHEISVKNNKGINELYQDIIFFYYQKRIKQQVKDNNIIKKNNKVNTDVIINKPKLNKNLLIFHQMIDKLKQNFIKEISDLKKEKNNENNIIQNLEKKIETYINTFNKEKKELKEKLKIYENKNIEVEKNIKIKEDKIKNLENEINNILIINQEINLKFKLSGHNEIINIKTKLNSKFYEILNTLYELYPELKEIKIKSFNLEGNSEHIIDEMKTISENKLINDSIIIFQI